MSACKFLVPVQLHSVVLHGPDAAGRVIAVDIGAPEFRKPVSGIDQPAGERARLRVMVLDRRLREWRRPGGAIRVELVASLEHAPAVIRSLLDEISGLPQVLSVVPDPELASLGVAGDPPWVAEAIGPRLGREPLVADERIIFRDPVG